MTRAPKVGVFGGTFNPIHLGHLRAAEEVLELLELERMLFVPSASPPHKGDLTACIAPAQDRFRWVQKAIAGQPRFAADPLELERTGPSYTVDTLTELAPRFAPEKPVFVIGDEAFAELGTWREPKALFALAHFAVLTRPPVRRQRLLDWLPEELEEAFDLADDGVSGVHRGTGTWLRLVAIRGLDISATDVRARLREGRSIRYLVPEEVRQEIVQSGVYGAAGELRLLNLPGVTSERVRRMAAAALERKARDVVALDVRGLTSVADVLLIASGSSDRQVRAIADAVLEAGRSHGEEALGIEGYDEGRWVLIDLNDLVVHVFSEELRRHYDLERLWSDAPAADFVASSGGPERRSAR